MNMVDGWVIFVNILVTYGKQDEIAGMAILSFTCFINELIFGPT